MPEWADSQTAPGEAGRRGGDGQAPPLRGARAWLLFLLGLGLQTFLWFLLFLAIVVAVLVGHQLTEFRYVGF
jgi:hypothetical protein